MSTAELSAKLSRLPTREAVKAELARRALIAAEAHAAEAAISFEAFVRITTPGYRWGWFNRQVCAELQAFYEAAERHERPRLMLIAPPRHGKSLLVSQKFPAYVLGKQPDWEIIATSYSFERAALNNLDVQRLLDSEAYQAVFPETKLRGATAKGRWLRTSDVFEVVGRKGKYRAAGVDGKVTGFGGNIIIIDDPIKDRAEAESVGMRDKAWEWYRGTLYPRLEKGAGFLLIQTRWHQDDLAGRLLDAAHSGGDQWKVCNFPAVAEEDEPHRKAGEALHEERHPLIELQSRRIVSGEYNWAAEFQGRPSPREGGMFKPDRMPVDQVWPDLRFGVWIRAWDLASVEDRRGDWTVGALICRTKDNGFVIADVERFRGGPDEVEKRIVATARRDGGRIRISLPIDPGAAGKFLALYLTKALIGFSVSSSPETGSKELRAGPFAAQVNVGNVRLCAGSWVSGYVDELRNFPNGAYDDQVDASSRAFMELMGIAGSLDIPDDIMQWSKRRSYGR